MIRLLALLALGACTTPDLGIPVDASDLEVTPLERGIFATYFDRVVRVYGIHIVAAPEVDGDKLMHAAHVAAQYMDNDEDGAVDVPAVEDALASRRAVLMMFDTARDADRSGIWEESALDRVWAQDLYGEETAPRWGFDASLEEVLHLIHTGGYMSVWPDQVTPVPGLPLADAMDEARGGRFFDIPRPYPADAWYHYYDPTCDYGCQGVEYFYWGLTTKLGAQAGRCEDIAVEWEPCTPDLLESTDVALHALLSDPGMTLPTSLPDGSYEGI